MRLCLLALLIFPAWAANTKVDFDPRNPNLGPFPTDYLTTPDPRQRTGLRVNLPLPDCATRSSDCGEIALLNQLDGFHQNARITLHFSGVIQPETLRENVFIAWLDPAPGRFPVYPAGKLSPVNELVYEPSTNTGFVKPDEILEGGRHYLLVVTDGVRDAAGDPVEVHEGYEACLAARIGGDYCLRLKAAVDSIAPRLGMRRIVGASLFTTLSNTAFLEDARRIVQFTPTSFRRTSPVLATSNFRGITFRQQTRTNGQRFTDEALPLVPGQLGSTSRVAFFSFRSPRFLNEAGIVATTPTGEPATMPTTTEEIHGHVWLPSTPAPAGGYPVLLVGHGIGDSRLGMPTVIAISNQAGYAVVAINAVGHGYGPESTFRFIAADGAVTEVAAPGRGVDLDGGGGIDAFEGCIALAPGAPIIVRDCVRQTAIDYMQLVHAIREGLDVDGDGRRDLDPATIHYLGQSLGSMYGTLLTAVEPAVSAAVFNVPLGSATESGRLSSSATLQFIAFIAMGLRQPVLLNRGLGFVDQMPLRYQAVSFLTEPGARAIQDFWDRTEWLENLGAPHSYARHLRAATLPGVGVKRVLFQMAWGDAVAVNPSTTRLIRAAGMQAQTSLYRYDLVRGLVTGLTADPHSFLIPQGPAATQATGAAAIAQVFAFLLSGTEAVPNNNALVAPFFGGRSVFENPAVDLPESLNRP